MKALIWTIICGLLVESVLSLNRTDRTCPVDNTAFRDDFFNVTAMDFSTLATVASDLVIVGVVSQILLILPSCPKFCLTRYAAKAGPPINNGIQNAARKAAFLGAEHAASKVKSSSCKYNYVLLLLGCIPDISTHMTDCAANARIAATTAAIHYLKEECPKLDTSLIETTLTALLTVAFSPLVQVAIVETAKNLLLALPCGSRQIIPGINMPPLPGLGGLNLPEILPGGLVKLLGGLGIVGGILGG